MGSSHAASSLACLCVFSSSEKGALLPFCSHGRILDWRSQTCFSLHRNWVEQTAVRRLLQRRPRAGGDGLVGLESEAKRYCLIRQSAVSLAELDQNGDGQKTSRSTHRKSAKPQAECGQQLKPDQCVDIETEAVWKTDRSRSSRRSRKDGSSLSPVKENPVTTSNTSRRRKSTKESNPAGLEVRSVANAEDSCNESKHGNLNAVATDSSWAKQAPSAEEFLEEPANRNSIDASKRGRKSKLTKRRSGLKAQNVDGLPEESHSEKEKLECFDRIAAVEDNKTSTPMESSDESGRDADPLLGRHADVETDVETELEQDDRTRATELDTEANAEEHLGLTESDSKSINEKEGMVQKDSGTASIGELYSRNLKQRQRRKSKVPRASRSSKEQGNQKRGEKDKPLASKGELYDLFSEELSEGPNQIARSDEHISNVIEPKLERADQMCIVRWLVEAELSPNQVLFVVGDDSNLGAWDPSSAIKFSVSGEARQLNLWKAQTQIPFGTVSEYNYFFQICEGGTNTIVWRPGPKLNIVIPSSEDMDNGELTVQHSLDFSIENKLPALLWGGWWSNIGFPSELQRFLGSENFPGEQEENGKDLNMGQSLSVKVAGNNILNQLDQSHIIIQEAKSDRLHLSDEVLAEIPDTSAVCSEIEDAPLLKKTQAEVNFLTGQIPPKLKRFIRKRVFPREEPWLVESMILYEKSESSKKSAVGVVEMDQKIGKMQSAVDHVSDHFLPTQEVDLTTEILINSSKCTTERIAILEKGKLVELLLETVNSEINVGNVYLGVVKRLLPGMTGVFVDIGHPRVALLSITKNRYPFTFPPIRTPKVVLNNDCDSPDSSFAEVDGDVRGNHQHNLVEGHQPFGNLEHTLELGLQYSVDDDDDEEEDEEPEDEELEVMDELEDLASTDTSAYAAYGGEASLDGKLGGHRLLQLNENGSRPITVNFGHRFAKWRKLQEGMKIIVQVRREPLGKKGPKVCAFPQLSSRFWVLGLGGKLIGVSKKIQGPERARLKDLAKLFRKPGFDLTVRTEAASQPQEDLERDLVRLVGTWKDIMERAEAASVAEDNGEGGAVPALLHRAMGRTLSIVRDFFAEKVSRMVVDSAQTYHEVTNYLQEVAPQLLNRVDLYTGRMPIFDVFNLESEIDKLLSKRVQLSNGAYLVIEETEALVSIDVNGGAGMLGRNMKSIAILETNIAAARQIAVELRLRDIGGIIVIDFIDMDDSEHETLVYEEMLKAIQLDRSGIHISEISELGLMEVTRRRVRPSVTFMISDPCSCCHGAGRVESLDAAFSKIERAILRLVASDLDDAHLGSRRWPRVLLKADPVMFEFLTRKQRVVQLSSSLKVYIILKIAKEMGRGSFEVSKLNLGNEKRQLGEVHKRASSRKTSHPNPVSKKGLAART